MTVNLTQTGFSRTQQRCQMQSWSGAAKTAILMALYLDSYLLGSFAMHLDLEGAESLRTRSNLLQVSVGARTWNLHQGWQEIGLRGTGSKVWFGSKVLSLYLARHPHLVKDKSVLELGCGLGLLSLMATDLGAREVFATDGEPSVLSLAKRNLIENLDEKMAKVSVARLSWGGKLPVECPRGESLELILGSDIVYGASNSIHAALVETLEQLCGPDTSILLAYRPRYRRERFFWEEVEQRFSVSIVPLDPELAPEAAHAKVSILLLQKQQPPTAEPPPSMYKSNNIFALAGPWDNDADDTAEAGGIHEVPLQNVESGGAARRTQVQTPQRRSSGARNPEPQSPHAFLAPNRQPDSTRPDAEPGEESPTRAWREQLKWEWSSDSLVDLGAAGVDDMVNPLGPAAPASEPDSDSDSDSDSGSALGQ